MNDGGISFPAVHLYAVIVRHYGFGRRNIRYLPLGRRKNKLIKMVCFRALPHTGNLDFKYENDYYFRMIEKMREGYNTRQRECIVHFLRNAKDRHFTAEELFYALNNSGTGKTEKTPSFATIYRTLDKLEKEGRIRKYDTGVGGKACFQYIGETSCRFEHYHCKCKNCGTLFHLDCSKFTALISHIRNKHGFVLDTSKTVLYGICGNCAKIKGEKKL